MEKTSIIVIGSGVSGLNCARFLKNDPTTCNLETVILEARDRIGGRANTVKFGNCNADLGASWIHGATKNPIFELANKIGIKISKIPAEEKKKYISSAPSNCPQWAWLAFDSNGKDVTELFDDFFEEFQEIILKIDKQTDSQKELSQYRIYEESLRKEATKTGFESKFKKQLGDELYHKFWWTCCASKETSWAWPIDKLSNHSVNDYGERDEKGGDRYVIAGYKGVIDYLAKGLNILTSHEVVAITEVNNKIEVKVIDHNNNANQQFKTFVSDYVVVTVPLGVLKSNGIKFSPLLTYDKQFAIDNLGMGNLNKIVLHFSTLFWSPQATWMFYVADRKSQIMVIHSLFKKSGEPLCIVYLCPQFSVERHDNQLTEQQIIDNALDTFALHFGDAPRKYFLSGRATMWDQDKFSLGSYSHIPFGANGGLYDIMSESQWNNKLLFAGEATFRDHPATVDGAYSSGEREAKKIIKLIK